FGFEIRWSTQATCFPTQDSVTLSELLHAAWSNHPKNVPNPTKVSITLSQLESIASHTPSLFEAPTQRRRVQLQKTMDQVNQRFGGRTLYYANAMEAQRCTQAAPLRIAFNHIPDLALEGD
ncbi:MAG: hypothetical protein VXZ45_04040, partial [Verrucomicrobiota bacterium]|nr:hypothetical protein [Verrucomicrobiota bacterium]